LSLVQFPPHGSPVDWAAGSSTFAFSTIASTTPPTGTKLKIPERLQARLAALADADGKSLHVYMVEALERQAERAERQRAYLDAGDAALREYGKTGIAYAMGDVERYIVTLADGREASEPRPVKPTKKRPPSARR
jgi:predicted transcriptional regulator